MTTTGNVGLSATATDERLWTIQECSNYMALSPSAIYKLCMPSAESDFPVIRVGRRMRFRKTDIDQWLERRNRHGFSERS